MKFPAADINGYMFFLCSLKIRQKDMHVNTKTGTKETNKNE